MLSIKILKENNLFQDFWNNSNDGINVVDADGNIIFANEVSANYLNFTVEEMMGNHVSTFYPQAVLLEVLKTKKPVLDRKIHHVAGKNYVVTSRPIYINKKFVGAFSIFKDIQEIQELNNKIKNLELHMQINEPEDQIESIIGRHDSLEDIISKARRTVGSLGGPRHSIITGESGTGKTMLAKIIHGYAKKVGVINKDAPFIEVNCAQYTNPDLAAIEIFGSEKGAFTGSTQKTGLFEQANGGILFLDEAHALDQYQTMLLKAIEANSIKRIGGKKDICVDVIIIAASTKNLKEQFLPELYQRLAQYEMYLPPLRERSIMEKDALLNYFIKKYENAVCKLQKINYNITFTKESRQLLLRATYPRNIRQFRDIINYSIDAASPLITDIQGKNNITTLVDTNHLPFEINETLNHNNANINSIRSKSEGKSHIEVKTLTQITAPIQPLIQNLHSMGLGPRKISKILEKEGYKIEYYKVAYYLKHKL